MWDIIETTDTNVYKCDICSNRCEGVKIEIVKDVARHHLSNHYISCLWIPHGYSDGSTPGIMEIRVAKVPIGKLDNIYPIYEAWGREVYYDTVEYRKIEVNVDGYILIASPIG